MRVLVALLLVGCATTSAESEPVEHYVSDVDHCWNIQRYCPGSAEEDGCPALTIPIALDCTLDPVASTELDEAWGELDDPRLERVTMQVPAACAAHFLAHVARLDAASRVSVVPLDTNVIAFRTDQWDGATCAPPE